MSEDKQEKRGFFRRLFGRKKKQETAAPPTEPAAPPAAPEAEPAAPEAEEAAPASAAPSAQEPEAAGAAPEQQAEAQPQEAPAPQPEQAAPPAAPEVEPAASEIEPEPVPAPAETAKTPPKPEPEHEPKEPEPASSGGFFSRLKRGLAKTSSRLAENIGGIFTKRKLDDEMLQDLEDILIQADLGIDMSERIIERLRRERFEKNVSPEEVQQVMAEEIAAVMEKVQQPFAIDDTHKPFVVLVVGVNGSGKTTTIGKLAAIAKREGHEVMLVAGDTFRAAAVEQLKIWAERSGARFMSRETGADAAALAYDALQQAREEGVDIVFMDTAGRLQNRKELMDELAKIVRVMRKVIPEAPHAVLLVLDATTGQNALNQVQVFREVVGVTGLVMTKLDGTARGGILVAIAEKHGLPVHAIGVGEGIDDLQPFDAQAFARAIAGLGEEKQ